MVVDAVHDDQIREHGGLPGLRDENALDSALARPRQKWHYVANASIPALAAAHGFGIARNHPYRDGNKRTALLAIVTFVELNGYAFDAADAEVLTEMLALADGRVTEAALAGWVRRHTAKRP